MLRSTTARIGEKERNVDWTKYYIGKVLDFDIFEAVVTLLQNSQVSQAFEGIYNTVL